MLLDSNHLHLPQLLPQVQELPHHPDSSLLVQFLVQWLMIQAAVVTVIGVPWISLYRFFFNSRNSRTTPDPRPHTTPVTSTTTITACLSMTTPEPLVTKQDCHRHRSASLLKPFWPVKVPRVFYKLAEAVFQCSSLFMSQKENMAKRAANNWRAWHAFL